MLRDSRITGKIIEIFYRVYDRLGFGFLESVYCEALAYEFRKNGLVHTREPRHQIWYEDIRVGRYRSDFLVENKIVVEVKSTRLLADADSRQMLNELRCSDNELGLLLHFGPKPRVHRMIFTNDRKLHTQYL